MTIVGLADRACQEAKERVRSGIVSAELNWPDARVVVNLAPAGLRKEGSAFDLSIALAILAASGQVDPASLRGHAVVGELALDGRLRPVGGVLAVAEGAKRIGLERILCPAESSPEAALAGVEPIPVRHLSEAVSYLSGGSRPPPYVPPNGQRPRARAPDLADVRGQERAPRAVELAAAGRHNLLLLGPPGRERRWSRVGCRESSATQPRAGARGHANPLRCWRSGSTGTLIEQPPFRAPHHSASMAAIVGGGLGPRPGEASLAHNGVLLLDEFPEFQRLVLEALRQPLEDGAISIARATGQASLPGPFSTRRDDESLPVRRARRPGGRVLVLAPAARALPREALPRAPRPLRPGRDDAASTRSRAGRPPGEASTAVRERVVAAGERLDADIPARGCEASALLDRAVDRLPLSGRGRARVGRVAATIAALAGADCVAAEHVAEALSYRSPKELAS